MRSMKQVDLGRLKWKQRRFAVDAFELTSDKDLVGVMYWTKWFSDLAVAKSADGSWHMDRPGFFRDRVIVTEQETGKKIAVFDIDWFGEGVLTFADGRSYMWYRTKAFCNHWALANEDEAVLFEIREGTHWFKHEADVVLYAAAGMETELPLLILISWYLVFMAIQDSAAVFVATSGVTGAI